MGTRQEGIKEHKLGEDAGWGLISDDLARLKGEDWGSNCKELGFRVWPLPRRSIHHISIYQMFAHILAIGYGVLLSAVL